MKTLEPRTIKSKTLPNVLTEEEVLQILESCPLNTPTELRNLVMLENLYSTGIRRIELVNLNVTDLSLEQEELFITKGKAKFTKGLFKVDPALAREVAN